jgi:hypothetical protein
MTKKADLLFMSCKTFGALYYHNVYSFYGEPVIFTALNTYGQIFFCYSLGCDETHEKWLITPISDKRAHSLEQKDLPIVKAISSSKQDNVLLIKACIDSDELDESWNKFSNLPFLLPTEDVFISENINLDGKRQHTHKIRVSRKTDSDIMADYLSDVTGAFTEFLKNLLSGHRISTNFFPKDAVRGSFMYRVKAENVDKLRSEGYEVFNKLSNKQKFIKLLDDKKIDLRLLRKLFYVQLERKIDIELIDEESTEIVFSFTSDQIKEYLSEVDKRLANYLDSSMVPQADRLIEIKKYLKILHKNGIVTAESFGKDKRQVSYYRDACELLSLIHDYNKLTPIGLKAIELVNDSSFIQLIKTQFENTECGYIWMTIQQVDSILDIDEASASDFLIENCSGLSENTADRRSQTLASWIRKFKEFA